MILRTLLILLLLLGPSTMMAGEPRRVVLIVWDGMRPDFVTSELTPVLWRLREQGVWFARHHAVYLSSTEANGTALATGAYPRHSGLIGNFEYRPAIDRRSPIHTEDLFVIRKGESAPGTPHLAVSTLAEILHEHDLTTAVAGTKPVALLHDRAPRTDRTLNSPVLFSTNTLPPEHSLVLTGALGASPLLASPNSARDEWTMRALLEDFWKNGVPRYSLLWLSEPDYSQHKHGPGSPEALAAIRGSDRVLGRVLEKLDRLGLRATTDVVVVSDHGCSTVTEDVDVAASLNAGGLDAQREFKSPPKPGQIMVVGNGGSSLIYVTGHQDKVIEQAVRVLQRQPFAGNIFTREGRWGTMRLSDALIDSPSAPDVVVAMRWQLQTNAHGCAPLIYHDGTAYKPGDGMHVTLSAADLHNVCVAAGPDFRRGITNDIPSGNVDIAPTLLSIFGIAPVRSFDGRVLAETLTGRDAEPPKVQTRRLEAAANLPDGEWLQYLQITEVNGVRYLDEGNSRFTRKAATPK